MHGFSAGIATAPWLTAAAVARGHERVPIIRADQDDPDIHDGCVRGHGRTEAGSDCLDRETRLARFALGHLQQEIDDPGERARIYAGCKAPARLAGHAPDARAPQARRPSGGG